MSTDLIPTLEEDLKAVAEALRTGQPIAPEIEARMDEHAEEFRRRVFQEHGYLNVAVPQVRKDRETGH